MMPARVCPADHEEGGGGERATSSTVNDPHGKYSATQMQHNVKQLYAAALDIDYGLAAGLYARLVLHKWKWAEHAAGACEWVAMQPTVELVCSSLGVAAKQCFAVLLLFFHDASVHLWGS